MRRNREGFVLRLSIATVVLGLAIAWSGAFGAKIVQGGPLPTPTPAPTPEWDTKVSRPTDLNFRKPNYPIAFVKAPIRETSLGAKCRSGQSPYFNCPAVPPSGTCDTGEVLVEARKGNVATGYHFGADIVSASNPQAGQELWIYMPIWGQVLKLFPRTVHLSDDVIPFDPALGAVVEPSLSEDGTRIYFSYFHDATDPLLPQPFDKIPRSGADLYAIDISPLLSNPAANIDTLPVTRLTTRVFAPNTHNQTVQDRDKDAMNIALAGDTPNPMEENAWGTMHLHPTEFRTRRGLYLAYVSNKRRLDNSNPVMDESNMNFNLHFQPILPDGTLGPEDNQFAYFTTTSALSPTPLREGLAFSYQATTEDNRLWHIQKLDSEGRWGPLTGYGHGDQLFHLGTFCVGDPEQPGLKKDYFVGAKYYNINNEAFGSLWRQDLSKIGKNSYGNFSGSHTKVPRQDGAFELNVIPNVSLSHDEPSPKDLVGPLASGNYFGKLTSPRCGGVNELYFAYSPTSANGKLLDWECSQHIYRSEIGFQDDLKPWVPGRTVANGGHYTIIRRTIPDANLLWPVPVVPWLARSDGDTEQQYTDLAATQPSGYIDAGEPFAMIGASALYNTDRRPPECHLRPQRYWHPWGAYAYNEENDAIAFNQDTWTWVTGSPGSLCIPPERQEILGVAINLTSNRTNLKSDDGVGYITEGGSNKEAVRLLGIYSVKDQRSEPQWPPEDTDPKHQDQSFLALIPSHVPIELQPLDRRYGMKLADVRSWHSLRPRESRTDCGGCHQHEVGWDPVEFEDKYAAGRPPLDMVRHTPSIRYDEHCEVVVDTSQDNLATESYPEWHADIWNGMTSFCGSCHGPLPQNGGTGTPEARAALYWDATDSASAVSVYGQINASKFGNAHLGALGSQLFWAAQGHRTDNRSNNVADYLPDYDCTPCGGCNVFPCNQVTFNKTRYGFHYSSQHDGMGARCTNGDQPYANWVFKLGKWIDNHLPRDRGPSFGYNFDWYHPTADFGLSDPQCATTALRVGWWDDTGTVTTIKVTLNETISLVDFTGNFPNGNNVDPPYSQPLLLPPVSNSDRITVEVRDATGNRQKYSKTVEQLLDECTPTP